LLQSRFYSSLGVQLQTAHAWMTVLGPADSLPDGIVDAHSHIWIEPIPGVHPDSPVLNQPNKICAELVEFKQAGGSVIVDCQPGGCGRNSNSLLWLAQNSGVAIICCSGFHRKHYYAPTDKFWSMTSQQMGNHFAMELSKGVSETLKSDNPVKAGFIKVAVEATLDETPLYALEAACQAANSIGCAIQVHTEKGAQAEGILKYLDKQNVALKKVILCHMDKRPDFGLHHELAQTGVLLEYDTFNRPKYIPHQNVWPLLIQMVAAGQDRSIAIASDLADFSSWKQVGGDPGLAGFPQKILTGLFQVGFDSTIINNLTRHNILEHLRITGHHKQGDNP
jgi:5-phospho-D-xylono-1,4-lactonase